MTEMPDKRGCTDGNCIYGPPKGMHTNGGCSCERAILRGGAASAQLVRDFRDHERTRNALRERAQRLLDGLPYGMTTDAMLRDFLRDIAR